MNEKTEDSVSKEKLFGLPRPLAGALISILIFTLILLWSWKTDFVTLFITMLFLGEWAISMVGLRNLDFSTYWLSYVISCIPLAIFGALILSKKKFNRIFGIILLVFFLVTSLYIGLANFLLFYSD